MSAIENCKSAEELTAELIRIQSTNPGTGEREMREAVELFLKGCDVQIIEDEVEPDRKNVIATLPGDEKKPALVWICHMDTVVEGEGWTREPFGGKTEGERIYGRGSCDMKSGLSCALMVFRRVAQEVEKGKKMKRSLRMICTVDEEGDMKGVDHLIDRGYVTKEDYVLDMEPTGGEIQMAHKGRFWVELSVHGITAHASKPEEGADAIAAAAKIITKIREKVEEFPVSDKEMGKTTVTFGQIQGGYQPYVVPDECKIWMDFRLAPPVTEEEMLNITEETCESVRKEIHGIRTEYQITGNRPFVEKNEESVLLENLRKAVYEVTGEKKKAGVFPGYTDSAVIAGRLGNRECMSYGPGDLKYAHKPDEFVEKEDIRRCEEVMEYLVREMCMEN
ncbi:MAG: M20 family metallopeptidase [Eubacterium sp.]|nr:M20 family metallopeptidase [Eubacterium sp.]MDY5497246.1 M20 family metallopeptidase [Anaerobutyricum sp.]